MQILNLFRRSDSRYYWFKWEHEGKTHRQSTKCEKKADAKRVAEKLVAEHRKQLVCEPKPDIVWEQAVGRWLENNQSKRSAKDDQQRLGRLGREFFDGYLISEINEDNVDQALREMRALKSAGKVASGPLSAGTKNRYVAAIKAVLNQCVRWGWLESMPLLPSYDESESARSRFLSPGQAQCLIQALPLHFAQMAKFSLQTGMRYSNVAKLDWSQIDPSLNELRVPMRNSKNKKVLVVPLTAEAKAVLRWAADYRPGGVKSLQSNLTGQVFWRLDGSDGMWHKVAALHSETWARSLRRANLDDDWVWHDLRHTWASWHVQNGTTLDRLKELGGWLTLEMVERYAHLRPSDLAAAAENIAGILASGDISAQLLGSNALSTEPQFSCSMTVTFSSEQAVAFSPIIACGKA